MSNSKVKKSGLKKIFDIANESSHDNMRPRNNRADIFSELANLALDEELTIDHEGALEETEALAESSDKLSKQLGDMLPVLEVASIARPCNADLEKVEHLLGEVERRVKIVRAALSRLESSGIVRASSKKNSI